MKSPNQPILAFVYVISFASIAFLLYSSQFLLWQKQIAGSGEDGAKNNYTVAYQLEYGQTTGHFEGMNHPFGEHVVFTDNQPIITSLLKLFGGSANWIYYFALFSGLIGGWCFFLIAQSHKVDYRFAILATLFTMLLSPQLLRLGGHYSLAYIGIIPIFIWTIYNAERHQVTNILALVVATLSAFIHPYFMMMLVLFWGCYLLIAQIKSQKSKELKSWAKTLLLPLVPVVLFQIILLLTDSVSDRPSSPYGFLNYRATWSSIFLPLDFGYFKPISSGLQQSQEGGSFIGWFAILGLIAGIWNLVKARKLDSSHTLLLAAIPILFLSVAFPFYIWKFEKLLNYLGPLQQFRGIARFVFVFYYAVNLFAIIQFSKLMSSWKPITKATCLSIVLLVFASDIWSLRNQVIGQTSSGSNAFHSVHLDVVLEKVNVSQFQAIIPLPYFHVGSENFRTKEVEGVREISFALSLKTGLPLTGVQMSRTSMSQTMMQLEFMSYLGRTPKIFSEYPSDKAFLLLVKDYETLSESSLSLIEHSQRITSINGYTLRSLKFSEIQKIVDHNRSVVLSKKDSANRITPTYINSFDSDSTQISFAGPSAKQVQRIEWTDLIEPDLNLDKEEQYELSFWFYAGDQHSVNTQVWLWERNLAEEDVRFEVSEVGDHLEQIVGDWILCTIPVSVSDSKNKIQIMLHRDGVSMDIWFDEVLLRNIKHDYFKEGPLNLNNKYIELPG